MSVLPMQPRPRPDRRALSEILYRYTGRRRPREIIIEELQNIANKLFLRVNESVAAGTTVPNFISSQNEDLLSSLRWPTLKERQ